MQSLKKVLRKQQPSTSETILPVDLPSMKYYFPDSAKSICPIMRKNREKIIFPDLKGRNSNRRKRLNRIDRNERMMYNLHNAFTILSPRDLHTLSKKNVIKIYLKNLLHEKDNDETCHSYIQNN